MNYNRGTINRKKQNVSSKRNMQKKRVWVRLFKAILICLVLTILAGIGSGVFFVRQIIANTPQITKEMVQPQGESSFAYAADGTVLEKFVASGANRIFVTYDEIPQYLKDAFVAVEDSRFYQHNGVDVQGVIRAAIVGLTSGNFTEGASTLTQQLIKNNIFPNFVHEDTFYQKVERKLQEMYLAINIEKTMSKEEILTAYMNTINLGQNSLGVQTASRRYFNKDVWDLTLSEAAVIAAITQNPSRWDPVRNPEANAIRRERVLNDMLAQGFITQAQKDEAMADDVYARIQQTAEENVSSVRSYFLDAVERQVIRDLQVRLGYTPTQAFNALYRGGLTIYTTQDRAIQAIVDEEVNNDANYPSNIQWGVEFAMTIHRADGTQENFSREMLAQFLRSNGAGQFPLVFPSPEAAREAVDAYKATLNIGPDDTVNEVYAITPQPQSSITVIDQHTGQVVAISGGRGEKTTSNSFNRATDATRQPGSAIKMLAVYAPALESNMYTLASIEIDEPWQYESGQSITNAYAGFRGPQSIREAINISINTIAVKVLTDIGIMTGFDMLERFGITTLVDGTNPNFPGMTDAVQPLALGGITRGLLNIEMTAAYAAIANGGMLIEPHFYTKVLDRDGNVLLDNTIPQQHRVIEESTAWLLTSSMETVVTQGTGTPARIPGHTVAGKTGTTNGATDFWFSGYTAHYTMTVWGGFDTNLPMAGMTRWHLDLWQAIMARIHADLPPGDFPMPASVTRASVCSVSGLLPRADCPTVTEYFSIASMPVTRCTVNHWTAPPEEQPGDGETPPDTGEPPVDPPTEPPVDPPVEPPADTVGSIRVDQIRSWVERLWPLDGFFEIRV